MLKVVICDDDKIFRQDLYKMLELELELAGIAGQIVEFDRGEALLPTLSYEAYDIIFLDIEMHRLNGMDTAKEIRRQNARVVIIFITSHPDFVFQGYEVRALNYILKPYDKEKIKKVLYQALAEQETWKEQYYLIEQRSGAVRLSFGEIQYFFSDRRSVTAVTEEQAYIFYSKLDEVEAKVGVGFIRVHNRYLVNLRCVTAIHSKEVEVGAWKLPVSRAYKQNLAIAFARQMLG